MYSCQWRRHQCIIFIHIYIYLCITPRLLAQQRHKDVRGPETAPGGWPSSGCFATVSHLHRSRDCCLYIPSLHSRQIPMKTQWRSPNPAVAHMKQQLPRNSLDTGFIQESTRAPLLKCWEDEILIMSARSFPKTSVGSPFHQGSFSGRQSEKKFGLPNALRPTSYCETEVFPRS